jgi:hypothetical protein
MIIPDVIQPATTAAFNPMHASCNFQRPGMDNKLQCGSHSGTFKASLIKIYERVKS